MKKHEPLTIKYMNYENLKINRVDFKQFERELAPQNLQVNLLFVDKSHQGLYPLAFQFNHDFDYTDDMLSRIENNFFRFEADSLLNLGEVLTINKNKRLVGLRNGNTVRYTHLVIIPEDLPSDRSNSINEKFMMALHALVEAMSTQKKIKTKRISSPQEFTSKESPFRFTSKIKNEEPVIMKVFVSSNLNAQLAESDNFRDQGSLRRLFEIQL